MHIYMDAYAGHQADCCIDAWIHDSYVSPQYWVSYPIVMRSAAGFYIGHIGVVLSERECVFAEPYSRETPYMLYPDAMATYYRHGWFRSQYENSASGGGFLLVKAEGLRCSEEVAWMLAEGAKAKIVSS